MFSSPDILSIHCEDGVFLFHIFFASKQNCLVLLSHRVSANFIIIIIFFAFYISYVILIFPASFFHNIMNVTR